MAISKTRKNELVAQYIDWMNSSQAFFLTEYTGLTMKELDNLRARARNAGGEFRVIKNTLGQVAFEQAGYPLHEAFMEGSTAIAFAFDDTPAMAKVIMEFARETEFLKIKGGYLEKNPINAGEVVLLADLPTMPVLRSRLIGTILAPAGKLARILNEPARQLATVINAYAESEKSPASI